MLISNLNDGKNSFIPQFVGVQINIFCRTTELLFSSQLLLSTNCYFPKTLVKGNFIILSKIFKKVAGTSRLPFFKF